MGFFGGKSPGHPDFLERKNYNRVKSDLKVFNDVDNRERAKALDKKQRRMSLEGKHENCRCDNEKC